jgi:hypothetical protein
MSDYNDIARRNPQGAMNVISSFGYELVNRNNLGQSLNELIANEGEPALRKVMEIHPDKDVILELFSNQETLNTEKKGCGCSSCNKKHEEQYENFLNVTGSGVENSNKTTDNSSSNSSSNILAHQTNNILIVASLFIATVLILKIK